MAWEFEKIDVEVGERPRKKYVELYEKILSLKIGKENGFQITATDNREAANIRSSVSEMLKKKGLSGKYVASNKLNKFVCWRVK